MCSVINDTPDDRSGCEQSDRLSYDDFSRRDIRSLVFHLLYAMEAFEYSVSLESVVANFNSGFNLDIPVDSLVFTISDAVINQKDNLDELYKPLLANWRFDRISVCTKLLLRLATWELMNTATDTRIVINEAVELAKCFAEHDSYRFINGILDKVAKERPSIPQETIAQ